MIKKYKVACDIFKDLDDGHIYEKGKDFPYDNREIPEERINMLTSVNNKMGVVLVVEKELEDYFFEELLEIAGSEKINTENIKTKDELIKIISKERKARIKIIEKLKEKEIEFDENSSLEELRNLFKDAK